ncbi:MAG: cytochrome ubiquinol oxidase subunit I, partial [Jatrophihabitantaceae bacterium]
MSPLDVEPTPIVSHPYPAEQPASGSMFLQVLRTTDHKLIGRMYMVTSFAFFLIGGLMALVMRAELARP